MIVRESINEDFKRGQDPIKTLNLGIQTQITNEIEKLGVSNNHFGFDAEGDLFWREGRYGGIKIPESVIKILEKFYDPIKYSFIKDFTDDKISINTVIDMGLEDGLTPQYMEKIVKYYEDNVPNNRFKAALIRLAKQKRNKEEIEFDNEYNTYVFIGFQDKKPITINNKKYYEDKFEAETMLKIDTFSHADLSQVSSMKLRAKAQYPDGNVYAIKVPKFMMDEERYDGIPEEYRDIIEKYKKKI